MEETYTVEHLLGVGSFQGKLDTPAEGFFTLSSDDNSICLLLLDTVRWFRDYEICEILADVDNWRQSSRVSVATTINSEDGSLGTAVTNLTGPLIIDWDNRRIRQFVLHSGKYPLRAPLYKKGGAD